MIDFAKRLKGHEEMNNEMPHDDAPPIGEDERFEPVDLTDVPDATFEPLAPGLYPLIVVSAQAKRTKSGTGSFINVEFSVVESHENSGRRVWDSYNYRNDSEEAQRIGLQQLKGLMKAGGLGEVLTNPTQLVGCEVEAMVGLEKSDQFGDKNRIKYFKISGGESAA